MPLLLVQSFVNTLDLDLGTDLLADTRQGGQWLREAGLVRAGARVTDADLERARAVRRGIRALLAQNRTGPANGAGRGQPGDGEAQADPGDRGQPGHGEAGVDSAPAAPTPADDLAVLRALAAAGRPRLALDPAGRVELAPRPAESLTDGLLGLLVIIRDAQQDGTWSRLKLCGNTECEWAFYDRSHSQQGSWCDMSTCGNVIKNRNLRARRRAR
jgi:hypothetical protein